MKKFILLAVIIAVTLSCGEKKPLTYTEEIIDNVSHIHNLEPSHPADQPAVSIEFVQRYGELDGNDPDLMMNMPNGIALDKDGNVFIADTKNHQIKKFDRQGNLLLSFGRRGQGPSEFMYPGETYIDSQNILYISDYVNIKKFTVDGEYLDVLDIQHGSIFIPVADGKYIKSGTMLYSSMEEYKTKTEALIAAPLVRILNGEGSLVCEFGKRRAYENFTDMMDFNATSLGIDNTGNYYLAFGAQNRIEKYSSDGALLFTASRALPFGESTEINKVNTSDRLGRSAIASMYNRFSKNIEVDGKNRLWVPTYRRQFTEHERLKEFNTLEDPEFIQLEVYDENGILLQRIPWEFGTSRQLKYIKGDRIFFKSWADMCVYEYKIVEL